jgi:hypothetical protein
VGGDGDDRACLTRVERIDGRPMAWWSRFFARRARSRLYGLEYRVAFKLYSKDAKREVEVLEFRNGESYLVEREWVEGTKFKDRHSGKMAGPFASPAEAENFIVVTPWFIGRNA